MFRSTAACAVTWALALSACQHRPVYSAARYQTIDTALPSGISGLALDEHGHLWAIPEREPVVAEIVLEDLRAHITLHPLDGIPRELDTEEIAYLGHGQFAIGVEAHDRPFAAVFIGALRSDGHIVVKQGYSFDSATLGVELVANNGVEALCGSGSQLLVGVETAGRTSTGTRFAPLVRIHGRTIKVQRLQLTSDNGKLSALSCGAEEDGAVELLAIERDFGVTRILRAESRAKETDVPSTIVLDLWPLLRGRYASTLNLEGIVRLHDGRIVVVNDNVGAGLGGPTRLMIFTPE
ncbi:hypothetical protein BH11MYX2_BH11MYX2_40140 [soil metagenome]